MNNIKRILGFVFINLFFIYSSNAQMTVGAEYLDGIIAILNEDGESGLLIQKTDMDDLLNWEDAKKKCEKLGIGWRLPTLDEMKIINYNNQFLNLKNAYWSGTEFGKFHSWIFIFQQRNGYTSNRIYKYYVRAVKPF
jgi:hypothetical protein